MSTTPLGRHLGLSDAVTVGLAAMVGAGVFTVLGPATAAAGSGRALLVALAVVAVVALCNALSSARMAAVHPSSGGTYVYGRAELGPWWGYAAGWCFVIGKTASCAAMATAFAVYVLPAGTPEIGRRLVAATAVLALTALTVRGVTRTAAAARILVAVALVGVVVAVVCGLVLTATPADLDGGGPSGLSAARVAEAAGLLFFAFAGYARIATLGEEVRDPARTIPRAIGVAFGIVVVVYAALALALLGGLGATALAGSTAPLREVTAAAGADWAVPVVVVAATAASLGALLALLSGVGRTTLAMARHADLPRGLAAVDPVHQVPRRAQLAIGSVVAALTLVADLRGLIGFSSFGVLLYYLVTNLSALAHARRGERRPAVIVTAVVGALGCASLALTLPAGSVLAGATVLAVGLVVRLALHGRTGDAS